MTLGSHQKTIGGSQTHLTPRFILDALGRFDLDPCAAPAPRLWDCATENWSVRGLDQEWFGRVWCNPPFHRYKVHAFAEAMRLHNRGVMLVHARVETKWFSEIWRGASGVLFLGQRVKFLKPDGTEHTANSGAPVALASFGDADRVALFGSILPGIRVSSWGPKL